uniref:CPW-WPC domain-containing protein n=1 Tax=viral metagenome TaxID=1070528 RepID=A0A6C0I1P4_9ZZZZ
MTFQMIVLWIAVLIFIATLGFIGYSIYTSQYNVTWPPSISDCPDYWSVSSDGKNCIPGSYNKCLSSGDDKQFLISTYPNLCNKYAFAKMNSCQSSFNWSGVSNSLKCNP